MSGFSIVAGNLGFRGYNTTMSQAYCPTANQLVNVMKGGAFGTKATDIFLQSGQTTAKVVTGDLAACNSIVHLVDAVLQPCCTSLYEMVGQFSIVQVCSLSSDVPKRGVWLGGEGCMFSISNEVSGWWWRCCRSLPATLMATSRKHLLKTQMISTGGSLKSSCWTCCW